MKIITIAFINGVIFAIYSLLVAKIILKKKINLEKKHIKDIILFFLIYYAELCLMDSIYAMFFSGICAFILIKSVFKDNIFMSMLLSLIVHTMKLLVKILILRIINNPSLVIVNTYKTLNVVSLSINVIALCIALFIIFILSKILRKAINYITSLRKRKIVLLVGVYLNFVILLIYQPIPDILSIHSITEIIMIATVMHICIFNLSSEMKMETLNQYYQDIFDYSKSNGELLTHYKMQVHENKNRLIMIKGMLDGPKNKIKEYIDGLLKEINNNKSNANYWLSELRYIPLAGVRNFINYKLIKLTELGAEIEVFVSSELERLDISNFEEDEYNQLSTILGVVLDNMIESVENIKEKLISINMYLEDNVIHAEFVNSFSNEVDLNRINEVGYTTKGEQHGVGLSLVASITKKNKRFECKPEIVDKFFVQHLKIKLLNKENLQKITKK